MPTRVLGLGLGEPGIGSIPQKKRLLAVGWQHLALLELDDLGVETVRILAYTVAPGEDRQTAVRPVGLALRILSGANQRSLRNVGGAGARDELNRIMLED